MYHQIWDYYYQTTFYWNHWFQIRLPDRFVWKTKALKQQNWNFHLDQELKTLQTKEDQNWDDLTPTAKIRRRRRRWCFSVFESVSVIVAGLEEKLSSFDKQEGSNSYLQSCSCTGEEKPHRLPRVQLPRLWMLSVPSLSPFFSLVMLLVNRLVTLDLYRRRRRRWS